MLTFKVILAFCVEQIVLGKTFDKIDLNSIILVKQAQCSFFFINSVELMWIYSE